jgi:VWFA-related protein
MKINLALSIQSCKIYILLAHAADPRPLFSIIYANFWSTASGKAIEAVPCVMRLPLALLALTATLTLQPGDLRAQGATIVPGPAAQLPAATFRSGVEVVTVTAAVRDGQGKVVRNLKKTDFQVMDEGFSRPIQDFYSGDSAVSVAILLDISGSMGVGGNMDRARSAVQSVLAHLQSIGDEAALYTFDSKLQEVVSFTTDLNKIRALSLAGRPWGMTSLYDAIAATAKSVADRANRHRAVLVITDGVDTGSRMKAPEVSGIASSIDVPVYLLTVVNPLDHPGGEFAVIEAAGESSNVGTLADLARWTGGDMRVCSMPEHTTAAVDDLFGELRYQYLITFEPGQRPGWHPLEIRTGKKDLVVHARSGYIAAAR